MKSRRAFYLDLTERAVWTFIQGAVGILLVMPALGLLTDGVIDVDAVHTALIAGGGGGIAAVLSTLKSAAGRRLDQLNGDANLGVTELRGDKRTP